MDAILEATALVLQEVGYAELTTNRVAQVAGVSVGSLYQYFPSKEALLAELIDRQADAMLGKLVAGLASLAGEPLDTVIRGVVDEVFSAMAGDAALNRLLFEQMGEVGRMHKLREMEGRAAKVIRVYLEMHRSEVRPADLELASLVLVHMVDVIATLFTLHHAETLGNAAFREEMTELVRRYVLADPSAAARPEKDRP